MCCCFSSRLFDFRALGVPVLAGGFLSAVEEISSADWGVSDETLDFDCFCSEHPTIKMVNVANNWTEKIEFIVVLLARLFRLKT